MKRWLFAIWWVVSGLGFWSYAQNPNPQASFSSAELAAKPSLVLNFNDSTTNFLDQVSQLNFSQPSNPGVTVGQIPATLGSNTNAGQITLSTAASPAGNIQSISVQYKTAPAAGALLPILIATGSGTSWTVTSPFSVTLAATTAVQTFYSGTNFPATAIAAGNLVGYWTASGGPQAPAQGTGSYGNCWLSATGALPTGAHTYSGCNGQTPAISASVSAGTPGTITPRRPGFDSTQVNNTSAEFSYNAWNVAPNDTLGAIDWNAPWTMMVQIDRLNWNRTGTLVLASKGDNSSTSNNWWKLYVDMAGSESQLCFERNGYAGGSSTNPYAQTGICTSSNFDAMPNNFNYNIIVEDNATGSSSALSMYINGLQVGTTLAGAAFSNNYANGFGFVQLAVAGGTGYANTTNFTSTGGGPNCTVAGTMTAVSGVPTSVQIPNSTGYYNYGCTSNPNIVLTSPIGTGAVITAIALPISMNSTTEPLVVPGYVSNGAYFGVAGTTSSQSATYVDEFAQWPKDLTFGQISNIFYETKFYQLATDVTAKPVLIFDNDAGGDLDNFFSLQMLIALHQQGLIRLAGAVIEDQSASCEATWRQMLDQAGLNDIPLAVPATFPDNSGATTCTTASVDTYNSSTPQSNAAWESAVTMYRTIFAKYPTTPIDIVSGAGLTALAEFMESPADSISPLTGLQLIAQNAANGGAIYAEGGGCTASSPPATTPCTGGIGGNLSQDYPSAQYVLTHNGALPIYWIGGTPQSAGPGVLSTRTAIDPMFLLATTVGTDIRQCYDCLAVEAAVSGYFYGGVQIGYGGGTGYASSTPFTLSGGGANCQGSGFMTASGGVPNGIEFSWGTSAVGSYSGLGQGCTSTPTVNLIGATGTGVTLTAYPALVCGTDAVSETGTTWGDSFTSATCSNQYVSPAAAYANQTPISGAPMEWFINSLVDPPPTGQTRDY